MLKITDEKDNWKDSKKILLVGKDGNGKKSCEESIHKTCNDKNQIWSTVGSGVGDISADGTMDHTTVKKYIRHILEKCQDFGGIKAIVFVIKYGDRFTKQFKDSAEDVKQMFGQDVFRKYGIIIMTHGDQFDMDCEDGRSFIQWCHDQIGNIKKLFEEVEYRVVLFDNKTKDRSTKNKQLSVLNDFVHRLNVRYGLEEFDRVNVRESHEIIKKYYPMDVMKRHPELLFLFLFLVLWLFIVYLMSLVIR